MSTGNAILDYLINIVTLKNVIIFGLLYFFIIWISIIAWVLKDITNRSDNIFIQILSVLIILIFSPFGVFLYLLIRPGSTLFEKYYLEVENNLDCLGEDIVEKIGENNFKIINCSKCGESIRQEFKYCPYCKTKVKTEFENKSKGNSGNKIKLDSENKTDKKRENKVTKKEKK